MRARPLRLDLLADAGPVAFAHALQLEASRLEGRSIRVRRVRTGRRRGTYYDRRTDETTMRRLRRAFTYRTIAGAVLLALRFSEGA